MERKGVAKKKKESNEMQSDALRMMDSDQENEG